MFDTLLELDFYADFVKLETVSGIEARDNGRIFVARPRSSKWNKYSEAML